MECQGIVTYVDSVLCYFNIDDKRVHMSLFMANNSLVGLPSLGSSITVRKAHNFESTYVVSDDTILIGTFDIRESSSAFLDIIRLLSWREVNIFELDKGLNLLQEKFNKISSDIKLDLIKSLCIELWSKPVENGDKALICISSCKHVELKRKYENFPHWSFGIHPKSSRNSILLGYLEVHALYGFVMLSDSIYGMPCIICNMSEKDLISILDSYVVIYNYKVITEVFTDADNFEYILVNYEDIKSVVRSPSFIMPILCETDVITDQQYTNCMYFILIRKSEICIGNKGKPECWLQIQIISKNGIDCEEMAFLLLPREYIKIVVHLKEQLTYKFFHNKELKEIENQEVIKVAKSKTFELVDTTARFQSLGDVVEKKTKHLSIEACKKYLQTNTELISFEGVIHTKRLNEISTSRSIKKSSTYGFGTPTPKSHQIVFSWKEKNTKCFLDWYLNDWENNLVPLGLIPEMRIIVRNVTPQSRKYLKSCIFTSFDIVSYEPAVDFRSVNLYKDHYLGWGQRDFLGKGMDIPASVLISGIVFNIRILSVKITYTTKGCETPVSNCELDGGRSSCPVKEKLMDFSLIMYVTDQFAESKVIVKDINFLKFVLSMQERPFQLWLNALKKIGNYVFTIQGDTQLDEAKDEEHEIFSQELSKYFHNFNRFEMKRLLLKCRKLDSDPKKNEGHCLWFYLDAQNCD